MLIVHKVRNRTNKGKEYRLQDYYVNKYVKIKGIVHLKMKIQSLSDHPHADRRTLLEFHGKTEFPKN